MKVNGNFDGSPFRVAGRERREKETGSSADRISAFRKKSLAAAAAAAAAAQRKIGRPSLETCDRSTGLKSNSPCPPVSNNRTAGDHGYVDVGRRRFRQSNSDSIFVNEPTTVVSTAWPPPPPPPLDRKYT
ncbi:hypothetical protein K0M31_012993 [Melipona bicolor]|uniref:Uncharacterized protein n=1 Tax=Melipona bicolor TaxID=60889 RepID=A0AA40KGV8_9HYME|nr:hypothetical protein K0M31_012993 [Melipona bicolor]